MNQIELLNISKTYDGKKNVIDNINLEVKKGEFVVLVGPSGCGKSTLLRMIAGLEKTTDGVLKINGEIANNMLSKDRQLSMVFQNYALYPHMTVRDNILFGLDVKKVPKQEQEKRLMDAVDVMGLTKHLKRKPGQLSGGERQRVALARSICSQAPICLMDEPLSNLDAKLRGQMRTEIRRIHKQFGLTIIYVTHDQVEAMTMGDRIMVLNDGKIQQIGTPLDLYNTPSNRFVASFIGSPQMNLIKCTIKNNAFNFGDDNKIIINPQEQKDIPSEGEFEIGIRAEHIGYSKEENENTCKVKVLNTELMGNETQVVFELNGSALTAKYFGQWQIEIGSYIFVELRQEYFHFFNASSGESRRAPLVLSKQTTFTDKEACI